MHGAARLPAAVLALLLLLVAACAPLPGGEATATLLTAGEGVSHNGRPATSGERLNPGDWVRTGYAGAALIRFSDGSTVRIAEAEEPVHLEWVGARLTIRTRGTLIETITGSIIKAVSMITDLAEVFNSSSFITVLEDRTFRHFLLEGRAELVRPQPGRLILPGQYALVGPSGEVAVRPIPPEALRDLRRRLDRWTFPPPAPSFGANDLFQGLDISIGISPGGRGRQTETTRPGRTPTIPRRTPQIIAPRSSGGTSVQ